MERQRRIWIDQKPFIASVGNGSGYNPCTIGCYQGWVRDKRNPMIHLNYQNANDPSVVKAGGEYYMYFTWRTMDRITMIKSRDGEVWTDPQINFLPQMDLDWEEEVSQPCVIYKDGIFEMWYTAKRLERSAFEPKISVIAHAVSKDGVTWEREMEPCFAAELLWEEYSVSNPGVLYDENIGKYRMWYTAGDSCLQEFIGYAESVDGLDWKRVVEKPMMERQPAHRWERYAVSEPSVVQHGEWFYMVYSGFEHSTNSRLCFARSRDGIHWEKHPGNPIITGGKQGWWDGGYTGKASLMFDQGIWKMWYTGHLHDRTNIGYMTNDRTDLGF